MEYMIKTYTPNNKDFLKKEKKLRSKNGLEGRFEYAEVHW